LTPLKGGGIGARIRRKEILRGLDHTLQAEFASTLLISEAADQPIDNAGDEQQWESRKARRAGLVAILRENYVASSARVKPGDGDGEMDQNPDVEYNTDISRWERFFGDLESEETQEMIKQSLAVLADIRGERE
jgi:hypothetical protein